MLSQLNKIDFGNERKARRSLVATSTLLLLFSNLKLTSNTLNLLGLEIEISQSALTSFAKILVVISFVALTFALIEKAPHRLARLLRSIDEKWWSPIEAEINAMHFEMDPNRDRYLEEYLRDNLEWDDEAYEEKKRRKIRRVKVVRSFRPIATAIRLLSDVFWPFGLALTALQYPEIIFIFQ